MRRVYLISALILILLLGAGGAAYWYLFGSPSLPADQLVPAETIFFATIPNAVPLLAGYQDSDLKKLLDDPTVQSGLSSLKNLLGKNADLLQTLWPEMSGQSFLALTHLDPDHPENDGFIAGLKPLPGTDHFEDFLTKFKEAYGSQLSQGSFGNGDVGGVPYTWYQPPGTQGHICLMRYQGWILTSWGTDALADWLQRYQRKSTSASLSQNANYQTSLQRVGTDNLTYFYLSPTRLLPLVTKYLDLGKRVPSLANQMEAVSAVSLIAVGTKFHNGKIVDSSSLFLTPTGKAQLGLSETPCSFDTLKFTNRNTCLYVAGNRDWNQVSTRFSENMQKLPGPQLALMTMQAQTLKNMGIDLQQNIIQALGPEFSLQMDWDDEASFPDIGFFIKIDKPDVFQPVIKAIHDYVYKMTSNYGVITELNVGPEKLATFHFAPKEGLLTPTITENGPYFAFFLTQKYAANCFSRDPNGLLSSNADFQEAVGDKLTTGGNASELMFVNSPHLLDRSYQALLPFVVMAAQTNKTTRDFLRDHEMPKNLAWLAPIGSWTGLQFMDEAGLRGYSYSGAGNQSLLFAAAAGAGALMTPYLLPKAVPALPTPLAGTPPDNVAPETNLQSSEMIRDELTQLRTIILAWTKDKKIAPGTPVDWTALTGYFIPESRLEQSGGKDALGHYYDLGVVGVRVADVSAETKKTFADKPETFWQPALRENAIATQAEPVISPPVTPPANSILAPPPEPAPPPMTNLAPAQPTPEPPAPVTNAAPVSPAAPSPMTNPAPSQPTLEPPAPVTNAAPVAPAPLPTPLVPPPPPPAPTPDTPHVAPLPPSD